jgi:hypothetical protein
MCVLCVNALALTPRTNPGWDCPPLLRGGMSQSPTSLCRPLSVIGPPPFLPTCRAGPRSLPLPLLSQGAAERNPHSPPPSRMRPAAQEHPHSLPLHVLAFCPPPVVEAPPLTGIRAGPPLRQPLLGEHHRCASSSKIYRQVTLPLPHRCCRASTSLRRPPRDPCHQQDPTACWPDAADERYLNFRWPGRGRKLSKLPSAWSGADVRYRI